MTMASDLRDTPKLLLRPETSTPQLCVHQSLGLRQVTPRNGYTLYAHFHLWDTETRKKTPPPHTSQSSAKDTFVVCEHIPISMHSACCSPGTTLPSAAFIHISTLALGIWAWEIAVIVSLLCPSNIHNTLPLMASKCKEGRVRNAHLVKKQLPSSC